MDRIGCIPPVSEYFTFVHKKFLHNVTIYGTLEELIGIDGRDGMLAEIKKAMAQDPELFIHDVLGCIAIAVTTFVVLFFTGVA